MDMGGFFVDMICALCSSFCQSLVSCWIALLVVFFPTVKPSSKCTSSNDPWFKQLTNPPCFFPITLFFEKNTDHRNRAFLFLHALFFFADHNDLIVFERMDGFGEGHISTRSRWFMDFGAMCRSSPDEGTFWTRNMVEIARNFSPRVNRRCHTRWDPQKPVKKVGWNNSTYRVYMYIYIYICDHIYIYITPGNTHLFQVIYRGERT